jgi:ATP-binding cassette subfamily B protein
MPKEGRSVRAKLSHFWAQLGYLPRTLRLIWSAAGWWTLAWFVLLVVLGVLPAVTVYLSRSLVDSLVGALAADLTWESIWPTITLALWMAGLMVLTQIAQSVMDWVRTAQSEIIGDYLSALVHGQATTLDLAFYETPEYQDRLHQARTDLQNRPLALLENGGGLVQSGITLTAMAAVLLPYGPWLPLVLLVSTLPGFYVVIRHNRRHHRWWERTTEERRWANYYDILLTAESIAGELRVFGLGDHFRSAYQGLRSRLRSERLRLARSRGRAQLGASSLATALSGAATIWMIWRAFNGQVTLGDLALFYQAFSQGQALLRSLLGNVGRIYENILFLGNLFEFLDMRPEIVDPRQPKPTPATLQQGIRFQEVTFSYPGSARAVLQDFTFEIPAGKVVAIVGANGAGKTTLVKLLCRLYDPQRGSIQLDGTDLCDLPVEQMRRLVTVLFQFPAPYFTRVVDNIKLGDVTADPDMDAIESAARSAGAHEFIMRLPEGYDTLLGKWFVSGAELSGGEWQRLALARAFLRRAQIMILDEPTSFMDSWAEVDWFDRFRELAAGRTAIFITHRFLIAKRADIIHVMDAGRIVESGSHDELLALGGRYAQSWAAQLQASAQSSAPDPDESVRQAAPGELFAVGAELLTRDDGPKV